MVIESVEEDDPSRISTIYESLIDLFFESVIGLFQSMECDFVCDAHIDRTVIEAYGRTTIIASCIMDIFFYISESFFIDDLMKSLEIRCDRSCRLDIGKIFRSFRIECTISERHILISGNTIDVGIFLSFICLIELLQCRLDICEEVLGEALIGEIFYILREEDIFIEIVLTH